LRRRSSIERGPRRLFAFSSPVPVLHLADPHASSRTLRALGPLPPLAALPRRVSPTPAATLLLALVDPLPPGPPPGAITAYPASFDPSRPGQRHGPLLLFVLQRVFKRCAYATINKSPDSIKVPPDLHRHRHRCRWFRRSSPPLLLRLYVSFQQLRRVVPPSSTSESTSDQPDSCYLVIDCLEAERLATKGEGRTAAVVVTACG
jgi:hypothetical protein